MAGRGRDRGRVGRVVPRRRRTGPVRRGGRGARTPAGATGHRLRRPGDPRRRPARFTSPDALPADLRCADLHGAVLDGLDLGQRELEHANLSGASLRHTDLTQAHLRGADLHGADLSFADLTQADLRDADLHGATLWLTGSIEAETDGVRVWPVENGAIQIGYLLVVAALVLLGVALVRVVRGVPSPGTRSWRRLRPRARIALGLVPAAVLVTVVLVYPLFTGLAAIWAVEVIQPLLITAGVLIVTAAVEQAAP